MEDPAGAEGGSKGKGKAKSRTTGAQTLQQALKWVQEVLELKDKFTRVWSEAFNSDRELETAMVEVRLCYDAHTSSDRAISGIRELHKHQPESS